MYPKCFCGRGAVGAHGAPPDPLAVIRGPLRGKEGRGREEGEAREGKEK